MRYSFKNILFTALVILLFALPYFSYKRINQLGEAYNWVEHTHLVKMKLQDLLLSVVNCETWQRGYLLTSEESFLGPCNESKPKITQLFREIDSLSKDNPAVLKRVHEMRAVVDRRLAILKETIELKKYPDKQEEFQQSILEGQRMMDIFRSQIAEITKVQDDLLNERIHQKEEDAYLTPILILIITTVTLIILIFSFLKIRQDSRRLYKLNKNLHDRDLELSARNQQLADSSILLQEALQGTRDASLKLEEANMELANKNMELEAMNKELSSFSYVASHDLKEPLRKIQTFANRMLDKEKDSLNESTKEYLDRIMNACSRMQKLIDALLDFSRTTNSQVVFVPTDLNKTLADVKIVFRDIMEEKNAEITHDPLPEINAIPIQMHQLFLNLIGNSLKYSKPGLAPKISIAVEHVDHFDSPGGQMKGKWLKLVFRDNGIGFSQEYEHKIFELFQRLHGKSEYEGTGIGLAICKKIATTHKGHISAKSEPDNGSEFTVLISEELKTTSQESPH
jgi:signal transduction histidine kinase